MTPIESPDSNACLSSPGGPLYDAPPIRCDACGEPLNDTEIHTLGDDVLCRRCAPVEAAKVLVESVRFTTLGREWRDALGILRQFVALQERRSDSESRTLTVVSREVKS